MLNLKKKILRQQGIVRYNPCDRHPLPMLGAALPAYPCHWNAALWRRCWSWQDSKRERYRPSCLGPPSNARKRQTDSGRKKLGQGLQRIKYDKRRGSITKKGEMSFYAVQDQATEILSEANWQQNISNSRLKPSIIITHLLKRITQKLHKITSLIPTKNKNHINPPFFQPVSRYAGHHSIGALRQMGQTWHVFGQALQHKVVL